MSLLLPPAPSAPAALVVFLGALVSPTVYVGFTLLKSVWLTYIALYYIWVVAPIAVCFCWSGSRQRVVAALKRGFQRIPLQCMLAVPAIPLFIGSGLLVYHFLARPLGIIVEDLRHDLATWGLTRANPGGDMGELAWLTFLNPVMEEFFWRVFLFESLRASRDALWLPRSDDEPPEPLSTVAMSRWEWRWWGPALGANVLYACYHVPVIYLFLPPPLTVACWVGLVLIGLSLTLVIERFGLITAVGWHLAADAIVSLIVMDAIFGWGIG